MCQNCPMNLEYCFCSVTRSCLILCDPKDCSNSRLPYPSVFPRVCLNSCPLSQWCYLAVSSSAAHFSFGLPSSPESGSFQRVGSSHQMVKVLELQLQHQFFQWILRDDFFRIDWFDLLAVQCPLKSLLQHHNSKVSILELSLLHGPTFTSAYDYRKSIA